MAYWIRGLFFVSVVAFTGISFAQRGSKPKMLYIVKNGGAVSTIVIPENADPWTRKAAQWLREYIQKSTGADLAIVSEDRDATGTIISVGHTRLAKQAGVDTRDLEWDGCKLIVRKNVLYLIGRDRTKEIPSEPATGPRGTAKAVLAFLEDFCGVRWFVPTPMGEMVPRAKNIRVPGNLSKTITPAFAYSRGRTSYPPGSPVSLANNLRDGVGALVSGHSYAGVVPGDKYFKDHPEYFALIKGKRTAECSWPGGEHLCSSNPQVRELHTQWMRARFDEGYEWVFIGQEDGYRRCECEECEKLDDYRWEETGLGWDDYLRNVLKDTPCERLFLMHKNVMDGALKSNPGRKAILNSYAPTSWPSKKIAHFGDDVIVHLMNQEPEFIAAWKDKAGGIVGFMYWFLAVLPMGMDVHVTPRELSDKIRYLHENRFVGLYHYTETNFGFQGPVYYVLGKMMCDPSLDYKTLVDEYCRGMYDGASGSMSKFFDLLYTRHEEVLPLPVDDFGVRTNKISGWAYPPSPIDRWMTTAEVYLTLYSPNVLNSLEELLDKAELEANTGRSRGWVRHTRDYFDFTKLLTYSLISYRAYQVTPSKENWQELKQRVEAFDDHRMKIITYPEEYTDDWFPGYDTFCKYLTADAQSEVLIYYMPWEKRKEEVLKKGVKGTAVGYGGRFGYSFVKEPFTIDFSKGYSQ